MEECERQRNLGWNGSGEVKGVSGEMRVLGLRKVRPAPGVLRSWKRLRVAEVTGLVLLLVLAIWRSLLVEVENSARVIPDYEQVELEPLLEKAKHSALSRAEYKLLYEQTGLGPAGVDALIMEGRQEVLQQLQENLFAVLPVECTPNTIITREERTRSDVLIPYIEAGDILVTFNCHAFVWRNGHAAIVADAEEHLLVESGQLGTKSKVVSLAHWESYPAFAVLRLKDTDQEERAAVGEYAKEKLVGVTYRLEAAKSGLQRGTHCAHLTWYAYDHFGFDIDSDGGLIVTPKDIFDSELLEIVQIYGMKMPDFEEIY